MMKDMIARILVAIAAVVFTSVVAGSVIAYPYLLAVYIGLPAAALALAWAIRRVWP